MENASKALEIVFAVIVLVMALSIAMYMFAQAREVADIVAHSADITKFIEYKEDDLEGGTRRVGLETIVPSMYRYYKENYTIIFLRQFKKEEHYMPLDLYRTVRFDYRSTWNKKVFSIFKYPGYVEDDDGSIGHYYNSTYGWPSGQIIPSLDVNEEIARGEAWTISQAGYKTFVDKLLSGNVSSNDILFLEGEEKSFIRRLKVYDSLNRDYTFIEYLGEYSIDDDTTENAKKKRVVIYKIFPRVEGTEEEDI